MMFSKNGCIAPLAILTLTAVVSGQVRDYGLFARAIDPLEYMIDLETREAEADFDDEEFLIGRDAEADLDLYDDLYLASRSPGPNPRGVSANLKAAVSVDNSRVHERLLIT